MCSHSNFILIFLIFLILTLLIFSVLYYKYELQIKIWLYNRNLCMRFLVEDDLDKNKEYDVFVSYSHKDSEFVEKGLVPILEKAPFGFKLCLHYRDWTPGSFITQNIANSVAKSRRTLIVLTPNFLNSIWGKLEFRTAHAEAMAEKRNRVILLLKEDIDVESLDDELKSYISTNTYLKWGDNWFWKKLRYALPHKQREELKEIKVNPNFQRNFHKMRRYRPRKEINH